MKIQNTGPRKPWDRAECEALVNLYNTFLLDQLNNTEYQKAGPVRQLASDIGRSKGSIEAKLMNVSGIRKDLGLIYVNGYKPLGNAQKLLLQVVLEKSATEEVSMQINQLVSVQC